MKQPKYLTTADKKVVIVYDNIDEAPIHSATPLENIKVYLMVIIHLRNYMNLEKCIMLYYLIIGQSIKIY